MADDFNPDDYLKKKKVQSSAQGFDPDAYLAAKAKPISNLEDSSFQLQPAGEYRGYSMLGSPSKEGTYATPNVRKEAIDRLIERGDGSVPADARPEGPRPDRSARENMEAMYSPENLKKSQKALSGDIGDMLYSFANIGGFMPRARGKIAALGDKSEGDFDSKVAKQRAIESEVASLRKERSPTASSLGGIARDLALYATGSGLLSKAPIVGAGKAGGAAEALKLLARGGILGAGVGQASGHSIEDAPTDAAFGAGGEALGAALPYAVGKSVSGVQKLVNFFKKANERGTLPKIIANTLEKPLWWRRQFREDAEKLARESFNSDKQVVKNRIDELKTQRGDVSSKNSERLADLKELNSQAIGEAQAAHAYNKTLARNNLRDLSENQPAALGENLLNKIKASKQKLYKEFGTVSDKLMAQHGDFPAPAEGLQNEIADILSKNGLINPDGKIVSKTLDLVQSPERKRMLQSLLNMQQALQENPSIRSLNALKQDLQSLANYGAPIRTAEQGMFGKLAEHAKSAVDDALSQAAGSEAGEFQAVRKKYAQQKPALDALSKTATRLPERLVVNARVQFPKSKVQELLKTNPEFKDDIGDFVFEHITQTPASQNTIRKTMDYYGRDFLKDLVGEKRFNLLQKAEEQLTSASARFNPKNFPNEEAQRRIGEILGDEMGPYSFDSAKKTISRKDAEAAAKYDFEIEKLKKKLLKKFEYTDPSVKKIQEKLLGILGKSKELKPNKRLEKVLGSFRAMFPAASNAARLNLDQ